MASPVFNGVRNCLKQRLFQQWRTGYIVLLPEVNPESFDQNPLFKSGLPSTEKITPEKCVEIFGKHILDFEHCVREIERVIIESRKKDDVQVDFFEAVVEPLETMGAPFESTWGLLKSLYVTNNIIMPRESYVSLHDRARRARSLKYNSYLIYSEAKKCDQSKLTEEEQRVILKFITEGKLNGLDLSGDDKLVHHNIFKKLSLEKDKFSKKVEAGKGLFKHVIGDKNMMKGFPSSLLKLMKTRSDDEGTKGPWVVTHSDDVFQSFMEYCPDRDLRWNAWLASRQICSAFSERHLQNSNTLEEIRSLRRDQAKLLGYENFADMSMETKMAGSVGSVQKVLSSLLDKAFELQRQELQDLQKFAEKNGFEYELRMWDIPFWQREQRKEMFGWDEHEVCEFFPLEKVLEGLINLCSELFSLRFETPKDIFTWHPDVKYYNIFEGDSTKPIAGLYLDPFPRENKIYRPENAGFVIGIRPGARAFGPLMPLTTLIFNFPTPTDERPSLLSFAAVDTLFKKFGRALQHLISTVNYTEVSGVSNIEWDAVNVVSDIMSLWLNDPRVLLSISKHYKTGEKLPFTNLEAIRRHMCGFNLCSELYLSNLDLQLHTKKDFWFSIVKELWPKHFLIPLQKDDSHPCSFVSCIAGDLSATYYSKIWSRMLATDAFTSFTGAEDLKAIGTRFRDTFLGFGGSCHPKEVFRRFQGRDPTLEAFVESLEKGISFSNQTSNSPNQSSSPSSLTVPSSQLPSQL